MKQIDVLVQKAEENIEVADMLLRQNHFDISASRAYYAKWLSQVSLTDRQNSPSR